jgi:hypothetical protein
MYTFKVTGEALSVTELTAFPQNGPPPHIHQREDESLWVLDGEFSLPTTRAQLKAKPLLASTLADFKTGSDEPREPHKTWLGTDVANLLKSRPGCWVDLIGHASRRWRGVHQSNSPLSNARCDNVKTVIFEATPGNIVEIFHSMPKGDGESGSNPNDDSPQFRSVEVLVYGPEIPKPSRRPPETETRQSYRRTFEKRDDTRTADDIGDGYTWSNWAADHYWA